MENHIDNMAVCQGVSGSRTLSNTMPDPIGEPGRSSGKKNPLKNLYFGEEHLHTTISLDAFITGIFTTLDDPKSPIANDPVVQAFKSNDKAKIDGAFKTIAKTVATLAGLYGALHGLLNGAALGGIGAGPLALVGIALTVLVIVRLMSAAVISLRPPWTRIVVGVAGSWVAAVGMLMFGWLVRGAT